MRPVVRRLGLIGVGAFAVVGGACSNDDNLGDTSADAVTSTEAAVAKTLFDVNDVSILFSKDPATGEPLPTMKMSDTDGAMTEYFQQRDFDKVIAFAKNGDGKADGSPAMRFSTGADLRDNWRVVGMRYDPCAPTTRIQGDAVLAAVGITECIVQVRLIVQPIVGKKDIDNTAHLVFSMGSKSTLGAENFARLTGQAATLLRGIKDASEKAGATTVGRTLGVHPGLAKDPATIGTLVRQFIATTVAASSAAEKASGKSTKAIAFMGLQNAGFEPWVFVAGRVVPDVGWTVLPMPAFPTKPTHHQRLAFIGSERVVPVSQLPLSTAPLFSGNVDPAVVAKTVFAIEQPESPHFFSMDCVSCHTSSSRMILLDAKSNPDRFRIPNGITGYARREDAQGSTWNVRNFGYFGGKPTVSFRSVTETVGVVRFMNEQTIAEAVASKKLKKTPAFVGPARDCTAVDDAVWDCFLAGGKDDGNEESGGKCTGTCTGFNTKATEPDEPEPPPPAPIDPIKPDPGNGDRKDPCTDPATENPVVSAGEATLTGNNAACLSRLMNGRFSGAKAAISCPSTQECKVSLKGATANGTTSSVVFGGLPARRLINTLQAPVDASGKETFTSSGPDTAGNSVKIECTNGGVNKRSCTVSLTIK